MACITSGEKFQVPKAREDGSSEGTVDQGLRLHAYRQRQGQRVVERLEGSAGGHRDDNHAGIAQNIFCFA